MKLPQGTWFILLILGLLFAAQGSLIYYERMPKTQPDDLYRFKLLTRDAENYVLRQLENKESDWHKNPNQIFSKLLYLDGSKECWIEWQASFEPERQSYNIDITAALTDGLMAGINGLVTRVISYDDQFGNLSIRDNQILMKTKANLQAKLLGGRLKVIQRTIL
jgi:hypothetical protein